MVIIKLKTESQTINRKTNRKVTKLKSKFYLFLGELNRALNNPALAYTHARTKNAHSSPLPSLAHNEGPNVAGSNLWRTS